MPYSPESQPSFFPPPKGPEFSLDGNCFVGMQPVKQSGIIGRCYPYLNFIRIDHFPTFYDRVFKIGWSADNSLPLPDKIINSRIDKEQYALRAWVDPAKKDKPLEMYEFYPLASVDDPQNILPYLEGLLNDDQIYQKLIDDIHPKCYIDPGNFNLYINSLKKYEPIFRIDDEGVVVNLNQVMKNYRHVLSLGTSPCSFEVTFPISLRKLITKKYGSLPKEDPRNLSVTAGLTFNYTDLAKVNLKILQALSDGFSGVEREQEGTTVSLGEKLKQIANPYLKLRWLD